jgi:hypothetical protein
MRQVAGWVTRFDVCVTASSVCGSWDVTRAVWAGVGVGFVVFGNGLLGVR